MSGCFVGMQPNPKSPILKANKVGTTPSYKIVGNNVVATTIVEQVEVVDLSSINRHQAYVLLVDGVWSYEIFSQWLDDCIIPCVASGGTNNGELKRGDIVAVGNLEDGEVKWWVTRYFIRSYVDGS